MAEPIDRTDIQGDIIFGFPKRFESFWFFTIVDVPGFRRAVANPEFLQLIKSTAQVEADRKKIRNHKVQFPKNDGPLLEFSAVNIAFTQTGLNLVQLTDDLADPAFKAGQFADAQALGDGKVVNGQFDSGWLQGFKDPIHGLILMAGESRESITETEERVITLLDPTITSSLTVFGVVRPDPHKGDEHFGYKDGISGPSVKGIQLEPPLPGQQVVDPGVILLGQPGDVLAQRRPPWAKNGSILVYRHLEQLVPEFDQFKLENPIDPLLTGGIEEGAALLGARFVGRWKSGAPVDLRPIADDPELAGDKTRNNNFDFSAHTDQTACPFAAHIRKMNPRSDLGAETSAVHAMKRAGIPFGHEVTPLENHLHKTLSSRGLAFVSYQSNLANGFEFVQKSWANNVNFIFGKPIPPGFDPLIGQAGGNPRTMNGYDPATQASDIALDHWVVSKGGAYLFSPSISVLRTRIGQS